MPFPDPIQESTFQEVFDKVNEVLLSEENPRWLFNEEDLRIVFLAGQKYGTIFTVRKFAKSVEKRLKEKS